MHWPFIVYPSALSGCAPKQNEILDINNLSGKTIGVILGNSPDYILTNHSKDQAAQVRFKQRYGARPWPSTSLTPQPCERDLRPMCSAVQPEYKVHATFVENDEYAYVLNPKNTELNKQFNTFIAGFRQTDVYKDILERTAECSEHQFTSKPVENTGAGDKVLRVLIYEDWEPVSFLNTETNRWEGADVELITHFANSIGARIEFYPIGSYEQAVLDLCFGKVDLLASPDSLEIKTDLEKGGNVMMSDCVWVKDIVFIVNTTDYQMEN